MAISKTAAWFLMIILIMIEVAWAMLMKYTVVQASNWALIIGCVLAVIASLLLAKILLVVPVGVAYPIWVGSSTVLIAILSFLLFKEAFTVKKVVFTALTISGIVGLKLFSN